MDDRALILTIVGCYLVSCLGIGLWASRRTKSAADFFIAGKSIGVWILGFASFSTVASGFAFIGGPGLVYSLGTSSLWICVPAGLGFALTAVLVGKRLRVFAEFFDILTLPDAIAIRYDSQLCRFLAALVILLGVIGYLGVQVLALGMVAETFFGIDRSSAAIIGVSVIVFYAVTGGILASLYTDVVQGALMLVASVSLFIVALTTAGEGIFSKGPENITRALLSSDTPDAIGAWGIAGPMLCLSWLFIFSVGSAGQPHVITKYFMVRRVAQIRAATLVSAVAYSLCILLWVSVGFAMKYLVLTGREPPLANADHAAPTFLLNHSPAWLAGIVFAGLFSAIMSTADAFLNIGAAVFVRDLPTALRGRPAQREVLAARLATVFIAAASTAFALGMGDLVAVLGIFSWGTFAAALFPVVAIGFNWKRATREAAAAAMLTGLSAHLALELLGRYPSGAFAYRLPYKVDTGAVALLLSIVVFVTVSFLTPARVPDRRLESAMDI